MPLRFGLLITKVPLPWYSAEYSFSFTMKVHCCMKRLLAFFLAIVALPAAGQSDLFSNIGKMEAGLSELTGLAFTRHVPYALLNKSQLRSYLEDRIKHSIKPADIRAEELTLKLLGLVPQDFDLRQTTVDLLTEQAAAFYDYKKKRLVVLEGSASDAEAQMALVHELAHALADQHFNLGKFIHENVRSDDAATARLAVMEGQATWLMSAYLSKQAGGPAEIPEPVLDMMTRTIESSAAQYPVFSKAPAYLRETLIFPYAQGMLFQNAVYRKLTLRSFTEVFQHPPESTQQILHPDRYLAHRAPNIPDTPAVPLSNQFRKLDSGTLGELEYRVLLGQYVGKADGEKLAAHLDGSSYALLEHKREKFAVLAFAAKWDSEESARRYFDKYRQVLRGKWKTFEIAKESEPRLEGRGDTGFFRVWIDGAVVNHLEGWQIGGRIGLPPANIPSNARILQGGNSVPVRNLRDVR
jgi:hypothetical protein